jgi:hypothetical protein
VSILMGTTTMGFVVVVVLLPPPGGIRDLGFGAKPQKIFF